MLKQKQLDKIFIEDLQVSCIIGIEDKERVTKQDVTVNITLFTDLSRACESDSIDDTVNYKEIKNRVKEFILASQLFLVEKMADTIARICLDDPLVQEVVVNVAKPGALTTARSVGVEIFRKREYYGL